MQHSIAAKYVARPAARFVRPAGRERERRLGLRSGSSFQPAGARQTVLRASRGGLQSAGWRPAAPARPATLRSGIVRPAVTISWARPVRASSRGLSSSAPAPWRG